MVVLPSMNDTVHQKRQIKGRIPSSEHFEILAFV